MSGAEQAEIIGYNPATRYTGNISMNLGQRSLLRLVAVMLGTEGCAKNLFIGVRTLLSDAFWTLRAVKINPGATWQRRDGFKHGAVGCRNEKAAQNFQSL